MAELRPEEPENGTPQVPVPEAVLEHITAVVARARADPRAVQALDQLAWRRNDLGLVIRQPVRSYGLAAEYAIDKSAATYPAAEAALREDSVFSQVIDRLFGTAQQASRVQVEMLMRALFLAIVDERGRLDFDSGRVAMTYSRLRAEYALGERPFTVIVPLYGLVINETIQIHKTLELAPMSEEEIDACASMGLLAPFPGHEVISERDCVAARFTFIENQTVVGEPLDRPAISPTVKHRFGEWRSTADIPGLVDDALLVLRLALRAPVKSTGGLRLLTSPNGTSISVIPRFVPRYAFELRELDSDSITAIARLWETMRALDTRRTYLPEFAVRRFTSGLDERSPDDQILDLMIAAEALFLHESGAPEERGELSYRLSLRAALLLRETGRDPKTTFVFMRHAYRLRSRIAHGHTAGSGPIKIADHEWTLSEFVNELFLVLCDCFVTAIAINTDDRSFGSPDFWSALVLDR